MRDFHQPRKSGVFAVNGMCAASHPFAAREAIKIMEAGGNAMDAALAAGVLLGITEPSSTGIGGDLFALIKPAGEERIVGFNASGKAPAALNAARLRDEGMTKLDPKSAHAITIPGAVDGICRLSADWGRKGLDAVLAPAIRYAEDGVPVGPRSAFDWKNALGTLRGHGIDHYTRGGEPYRAGDIFRAPGQAEVLRRIAKDGRAAYYEGEVMEDLLATLTALGGLHTAEDFAAQRSDYVEPISTLYRGHELVELPPNGQGATALLIANILSRFDLSAMDPLGADRAHLEAEASKLAYDARNRFVGDPSGAEAAVARMLSDDTAAALADMIDMKRALPGLNPPTDAVHKDTICLSAADKDGMVVSFIYSIFHAFGSGLASEKFGIGLHNRGASFSLVEGHPNELRGGHRPLHTIIPAMVKKDGKVVASYGVMGGQYQSTGHMRVLSNILDFGMDPQSALDAPRSFPDPEDGKLHMETAYADAVRADLAARGHEMHAPVTPIGGSQMIWLRDGVMEGASDPRKEGCALGY